MDWLVIGGAGLTCLGIIGLVWCILIAFKAKREGLEDDAMRARLQKVVAMNLGALALSALGLMAVIIGLFLG